MRPGASSDPPFASIGVLHPTFESWGGAEWYIHQILQRLAGELRIEVTLYTHRYSEPAGERAAYRVVAHRGGGVLSGPWDWRRIAGLHASSLRSHDVLFVHNHPATLWYRSLRESCPAPPAVWYCHEPPAGLYGSEAGLAEPAPPPPGARRHGAAHGPLGTRARLESARFYGVATPRRLVSRLRLRASVLASGGSAGWTDRMRRLDRQAAALFASVLANSRYTAERILRIYGVEAAVVNPLPGDLASLAPPRGTRKEALVLWAGRMEEAKRPLLLLEAWDRARRAEPRLEDYRLVFVGDGPLRERLLGRVAELKLGDAVACHQRVPRREMVAWMRRALLSVHLGLAEPFGLVPVESMAAGTAVLAEWQGGVRETVVPGVTGWCAEGLDEEALASHLRRIPSARRELETMGSRAADHIRLHFDADRAFRDLVSCLARAAGRRNV